MRTLDPRPREIKTHAMLINTPNNNNKRRALVKVLLFIAGATLFFAFGALFERHSSRLRRKSSVSFPSVQHQKLERRSSSGGGGGEEDEEEEEEEEEGSRFPPPPLPPPPLPPIPPSPLKQRAAVDSSSKSSSSSFASEGRGSCSIYSCVHTRDKNKFSFSAEQLHAAIEKEAKSSVVRVNVGDALKYTMKRCVLHPHNEFEIPPHKRGGEYDGITSKMEDLKTAMHRGIRLFPIVAHPLVWNVTDGVGVGHDRTIPKLPEHYLLSMRDLEKAEKIDEKYREKIESLMNAAKYWIDEAHALYEDGGGVVDSNEEEVRKVWAIWSGLNGFNYAYRLVAAKLGIGVVAFENAPFWRLIVDSTTGVASSQGSEKAYYWKYKDLVDENTAVREALDYKEKMVGAKGFEKNKEKWDMHVSPSTNLPIEISSRPAHRPLVVFLGHVYSDTSVTYMIESGFNDQVDVIVNTAFWCVKNDVDFVVKMHPAERRVFKKRQAPTETKLVNDPRWQKIRQTALKRNALLRVDGINSLSTYKLVDAADVVVTVLSVSGLESVIMGKEVILTGAAFYGKLGFTRDASNPTELQSHLFFALHERLSSLKSSTRSSTNSKKVALSPSRYKKAVTFFYVLRHYATVGRDDVAEIAKRIVRACVPPLR